MDSDGVCLPHSIGLVQNGNYLAFYSKTGKKPYKKQVKKLSFQTSVTAEAQQEDEEEPK